MTTRLVLADQAEARFYEIAEVGGAMRLVKELRNPSARLHDRDLASDRPGRVFDHAAKDVSRPESSVLAHLPANYRIMMRR